MIPEADHCRACRSQSGDFARLWDGHWYCRACIDALCAELLEYARSHSALTESPPFHRADIWRTALRMEAVAFLLFASMCSYALFSSRLGDDRRARRNRHRADRMLVSGRTAVAGICLDSERRCRRSPSVTGRFTFTAGGRLAAACESPFRFGNSAGAAASRGRIRFFDQRSCQSNPSFSSFMAKGAGEVYSSSAPRAAGPTKRGGSGRRFSRWPVGRRLRAEDRWFRSVTFGTDRVAHSRMVRFAFKGFQTPIFPVRP